jgi:hypothetical protein
MKKLAVLLSLLLCSFYLSFSQVNIIQEHFGTGTWDGHPSDYPYYTSSAFFSGDDSHLFQDAGSTGYPGASGGTAVLMGSWSGPENVEFVIQTNTEGYVSIRLSFGIKHNSGGWGTCQLTNNYTRIEYSTDSSSWTEMDKAAMLPGSNWPCADDNVWALVQLSEVLPSSPTLFIRFSHTNPNVHPYYLDDITISAFPPDNDPPTAPSNLSAVEVDYSSCILAWNASQDKNGIHHYKIFKDGNFLMSATDSIAKIKYQRPGSTANFSVIAYDISENASSESTSLPVTFETLTPDFKYSWETSHANILPTGDIEWQPKNFTFEAGSSVRYIDYEGGDDNNDGLSQSSPWKHHPWDDNATASAAAANGIHTYVFKRGVVYRGHLTAKESGSPLEPIRLTSDPSWGTGEAFFYGSTRIEGGWTKADATTAPNIPEPEKVWYVDISLPETKMVVEVQGDTYRQLHVARSPNYQFTEDDPLKTWWTMTGKTQDGDQLWLTDNNNLTQDDPAFYEGATIFSQEDAIVMCTVWGQDVLEWDPSRNRIKVANPNFGGIRSHYFIENTPFLLDTTNEFYYDQTAQRLYVRLEGDKDPNTTIIEAANKTELIRIDSKHDIEISGISFGITTAHAVRYGEEDARSTIRLTGINNDITIKNNKFLYVNGGITLNNSGSASVNTHSITVSDNDLQYVGDLSIVFSTSNAYMDNINILRNNIYNAGYRHQGRWYSSIPAIYAQLNYGEIAGNVINYSWGNGIDMFWGKGGGSGDYIPFIRGLIHQNKASNTLIGVNDYGGIESWQGGPAYCYNNYSHNASGYKHYNNSSIGYAYYFDGSFKHAVFNNIASGVSHNRNSASIMQVLGYYNMYVHNTGYNTDKFLNAWKGDLALNGHNAYLSNLTEDVETFFRHEIDPEYIPFESYGYNVASGSPFLASLEALSNNLSLTEFRDKLEAYNSQLTQTGWNAETEVLPNAGSFDFRPADNSAAIDRGVKFFTAFPLAKVVGEWNFYKHPADTTIIMGDNFYMTEQHNDRNTYQDIPKNHLNAHNVGLEDFVKGDLEDWTEGALKFDGSTVHCYVSHADASAVKSNNVDMSDNNFILEVYLRTTEGHTGGVILSKTDASGGYELDIDETGAARMSLIQGGSPLISRSSSTTINDTLWHHILVEVDRNAGLFIHIDGELSNGPLTGNMPDPSVSLSNTADLLVGKDTDDNYFSGTMDFLRISKGSLYEAKTTVNELYKWQTDGPFLYDMRGVAPDGKRDAGALETSSTCELSVSEQELEAEAAGAVIKITVASAEDFSISNETGDFFTTEIMEDTIVITVESNLSLKENRGSFFVVACNRSQAVNIRQDAADCYFECEVDTLYLDPFAQTVSVALSSNDELLMSYDLDFITAVQVDGEDSIRITIDDNLTFSTREALLEIFACDQVHTIRVIQEGLIDNVETNTDRKINVYPNPIPGNHFTLSVPGNGNKWEYTISDLSGRRVQNGYLHSDSEMIELNVDSGTYIIRVANEESVYEGRIVVL